MGTFDKNDMITVNTSNTSKVSDRRQAGSLLANRLQQFAHSDALVVAIPRGGVVVAAAVAQRLHLALEIFPCQEIKHPADGTRAIGSVSLDEVVVEGTSHDIPQDYISHQIALVQNCLRAELQLYGRDKLPVSFRYKTVIVVDDLLRSGDTMLACLQSIRKHQPLKLIVAVPFVSARAAMAIGTVADEIIFIRMDHEIRSAMDYYAEFPEIGEREVAALLHAENEVEVS